MDRRNFIKGSLLAAAAASVKLPISAEEIVPNLQNSITGVSRPDLVAIKGGSAAAMFLRGLAALGGISAFVKKGQKVLVKPNIGWAKTPEEGANTSPDLIKAIVEECLKAGASKVVVFDHTCNQWRDCYTKSGIEDSVKAGGGIILPGNEESDYIAASLPKGEKLKSTKVHQAWVDSDIIINVPVLKHHGGARMTSAMKNLMGVIWDRRFYHANDLHQCIADFATIEKKPTLNIVDADRVIMRNGPRGKSIEDVAKKNAMLISSDMVAIDAAAAKLMGLKLDEVAYLGMAEKHGIGTTALEKLKIERISI